MQPQAPANPAETFAKVLSMEAMEQTIWGSILGAKDGAERRGDLLYRCSGTAADRQA